MADSSYNAVQFRETTDGAARRLNLGRTVSLSTITGQIMHVLRRVAAAVTSSRVAPLPSPPMPTSAEAPKTEVKKEEKTPEKPKEKPKEGTEEEGR